MKDNRDSKCYDAEIGKYVTVARRSGSDWWIGTLNTRSPRTLELSLDFLEEGNYEATIYTDADDAAENPNHLKKEIKTVTKGDIIPLPLASDGGAVVHLTKVN